MERLYAILQHRLSTDVLDYEIIPYIYKDLESVINAGDLYTLRRKIFPFDRSNLIYVISAAKKGYLDILKWLNDEHAEGFAVEAINYAAGNGHLEMVKWLHANRSNGCTTDAMNYAAANGHLKMVKWLHANRTEGCTTDAMNWAAIFGNLEILKWLHENRTEVCTTDAMNFAALFGHQHVVEYLREAARSRSVASLHHCPEPC